MTETRKENAEQKHQQINYEGDALKVIGDAFYRGIGMTADYRQAFRYYRKAWESGGNVRALAMMGICYELGRGTARDLRQAKQCYEQASEHDDVLATVRLGDLYWNGAEGMLMKDQTAASEFYLDALEELDREDGGWYAPDVFMRIGRCLENGVGAARDAQKACVFYENAAEGFANRIEQGDIACESSLEEAETRAEECRKAVRKTEEADQ